MFLSPPTGLDAHQHGLSALPENIPGADRRITASRRRSAMSFLGGSALLALSAAPALAAETTATTAASEASDNEDPSGDGKSQITVIGTKDNALRKAAEALQAVPGTTAVIDAKEIERGRAANLEDTLSFQPGILAQATSGSTANKVSIRGSGAGVFYGGNSIDLKYLVDGLTISGVAGLHEDRLNTTGYQRTEVLYGANAFDYAATALGGAINFVTHTGRSAPGFTAHFEGGSFGSFKEQLSQGGTFDNGKGDYYVTLARTDRKGFQDHTKTWRNDAVANIGYQVTDKLTLRLIGRFDQGQLHYGGTLTRAQLKDDPSQNPNDWGQRRAKGTTMIGFKATYAFDDDSELEYGISYNDYPLFVAKGTLQPSLWRYTDINNSLRYTRSGDTLFGRPSKTTLVLSDVRLVSGDARYYTTSSPADTGDRSDWVFHQRTQYDGSRDSVLALGNELEFLDGSWLSTGLSVISIYRDVRITDRAVENADLRDGIRYDKTFFAPRIGLRQQVTQGVDLFANFSRLIDPPVVWNFEQKGGSPYNDTGTVGPQKAQRANSLEFGVKGSSGRFQGSLTAYRSWVKDEILSVVVQPATSTTAEVVNWSNASPTVHQGIEAGLATKIFGLGRDDGLTFRQALTVNDFHYRDDPTFGKNKLPSVADLVYQADLQYQSPIGVYANVNFRASSDYYVDYANSVKAPAYGIWGLKIGYEAPSQAWSTFLDFRNLTDRKYAVASYTAYDLKGADAAMFYPGDGFSVFAGFTIHLGPKA